MVFATFLTCVCNHIAVGALILFQSKPGKNGLVIVIVIAIVIVIVIVFVIVIVIVITIVIVIAIVIILMGTWEDEGLAQSGLGRHLSICRPGRQSPIRLKIYALYHNHDYYCAGYDDTHSLQSGEHKLACQEDRGAGPSGKPGSERFWRMI